MLKEELHVESTCIFVFNVVTVCYRHESFHYTIFTWWYISV